MQALSCSKCSLESPNHSFVNTNFKFKFPFIDITLSPQYLSLLLIFHQFFHPSLPLFFPFSSPVHLSLRSSLPLLRSQCHSSRFSPSVWLAAQFVEPLRCGPAHEPSAPRCQPTCRDINTHLVYTGRQAYMHTHHAVKTERGESVRGQHYYHFSQI